MPIVIATSRSATHGFSKQTQSSIQLLKGEGVEGDAHRGSTTQHLYLKRKNASQPNLCQVHILDAETLASLALQGHPLQAGDLGENILTQAIDLLALPRGTRLLLGDEAVVEVTGLRTPCSQIDRYRAGLQKHLWAPPDASGKRARKAGIMSVVLHGGLVKPGDAVQIVLPPQPHQLLGPV